MITGEAIKAALTVAVATEVTSMTVPGIISDVEKLEAEYVGRSMTCPLGDVHEHVIDRVRIIRLADDPDGRTLHLDVAVSPCPAQVEVDVDVVHCGSR